MSAARKSSRAILHVDMDAFYASVEALRNPQLRGKPLIVGGDGARGVVASCSYEARFYGVRSAMPSSRAKRMCPHAIFVSGSYDLYEKYSKQMHAIFHEYTPLVEGISLDEAFLDVTGALRLFGTPPQIGKEIRDRIFEKMGLRVSVGVASTKHVAKLASEAAKPTAARHGPIPGKGVVVVESGDAIAFLHALPVSKLWGVGPATQKRLASIGVNTVRDLARIETKVLESVVGQATAAHLHALAWNQDDREVIPHRAAKSIGHEQTYPKDIFDPAHLHDQLVRLTDAVTLRMRAEGVVGRTVNLKVRFSTFRTITRARSFDRPTANAGVVLRTVSELLDGVDVQEGVRLLGISLSNLESGEDVEQLRFVDGEPVNAELDSTIDLIRAKFGNKSVVPAPLLQTGQFKQGERQWGPNGQAEG